MTKDVNNDKSTSDFNGGREKEQPVFTVSVSNLSALPEKDYEPYEHRNVKRPTSFFETLMHLMKCSLGTGILAMPSAFANAGYLVGVIATLFIGFICTHSVQILISSEYTLCKRNKKPSMTYPETAEAALAAGPDKIKGLAKYAPSACNIFLIIYELGSCAVYVIFVASNLKDVVDEYQVIEDRWDIRYFCVFILPALIVIQCISNYKHLAPLSTIAIMLTLISFAIIFYYLFFDESAPEVSSIKEAIAPINKMPLFFGTVLFAMEAIGVVFPLENEMKNPRKFRGLFGVLNCAMVPISLLYTCVGLFGYLKYGNKVLGSITLSLPKQHLSSQAVRIMLSISIYFTHALLLHAAIDIIWDDYFKSVFKTKVQFWEYVVRFVTAFLTFALAVATPYLEQFISLIGALCMSTLGLTFPVIIETCTFWQDYSGLHFFIFFLKNAIIFVISMTGLSVGVYSSIAEIIEKISVNK